MNVDSHMLPGPINDTWRTWLMTGVRRGAVDRRRLRGEHLGLKRMLVEGTGTHVDRPRSWKDFSDAMVRQAVGDAVGSLPQPDSRLVKLAYFGGFSNRQIAREVGLTEATVQRRLRRAVSVISEHVQHGRGVGRRVVCWVALGLTGRWLSDLTYHAVQAAAVASVAVVVAAQPAPAAPAAAAASAPPPAPHAASQAPQAPSPSRAAPPAVPSVRAPAVRVPVSVPPVTLPSPPPLPVQPPARLPRL